MKIANIANQTQNLVNNIKASIRKFAGKWQIKNVNATKNIPKDNKQKPVKSNIKARKITNVSTDSFNKSNNKVNNFSKNIANATNKKELKNALLEINLAYNIDFSISKAEYENLVKEFHQKKSQF